MPKKVTMIVPESQLALLESITASATDVQVEAVEDETAGDKKADQAVTFKDVQVLCEAIQNSDFYEKVRVHVGGDVLILLTLELDDGGAMKIKMDTGIGMNGRGGSLHIERYGSGWEILRRGDGEMASGEITLDQDGCPEFCWLRP